MAAKELTLLQSVKVYQRLNRTWRQLLTPCEFCLLSYLVDASIGYGRKTLDFTIDQISNGSRRAEDDYLWLTPVNLSRATIVRALPRLRKLGVISYSGSVGRKRRVITVNTSWEPEMPGHLREPKRTKDVNPGAKKRARNVLSVSTKKADKCAQREQHRIVVDSQKDSPSSRKRSDYGAEEVIRKVKERKPNQKRATIKLWQEAWAEGQYGSLPPGLTAKERGQLAQAIARWPNHGDKVARWAIANWRKVITETFVWMSDNPPPSRPHPGFLLRFIDQFNEAYALSIYKAEQQEHMFTDKAAFASMIENGMSPEEAWKELGKQEARRQHAKEMEEEKRRVALDSRSLEAERKKLLRDRQEAARLSGKSGKDIIREYDESHPQFKQTRDYWSEDGPPPMVDFGEWEDDDAEP